MRPTRENKRILDGGSFEGPIGPIAPIGLKPVEPNKKRSGDEAKVEKISFMHVLDKFLWFRAIICLMVLRRQGMFFMCLPTLVDHLRQFTEH